MKRVFQNTTGWLAVAIVSFVSTDTRAADVDAKTNASPAASVDGAELFAREWIPGDARSHGGDGLGPLFNDSSCVACHNQGGVGGAGPRSKNVDIITAFEMPTRLPSRTPQRRTMVSRVLTSVFGDLDDKASAQSAEAVAADARKFAEDQKLKLQMIRKQNRTQLTTIHPGFQQGNSVVLHRSATYSGYRSWRTNMAQGHISAANPNGFELFDPNHESTQPPGSSSRPRTSLRSASSTMNTRFGNFTITRSQRNATALFGVGLIDSIKRETLEALAAKQEKDGVVSGRVALLKDKKIGRFGWKGQTASLRDFVLTACAVEVGLNVPEHPQSGLPQSPEYRSKGLDLNIEQCNALVNYVSDLPAPQQRALPTESDRQYVHKGQELFTSIGCAKCHVENVGTVQGIYSDLLLHDMGDELGDSGASYGVFLPDSTPDGQSLPQLASANQKGKAVEVIGATRKEWRTPALWGVRDSAPYMHDGRADDVVAAIMLHGGESQKSSNAFFQLNDAQQFQIITFMKSLVAPSAESSKKLAAVK